MKKSLSFFLCLVLLCFLFAGCAKKPPAETEPQTTDTASTQENPAEPTEPLSFSLGSLPQIGAFAAVEKREYFFSDGPHDTFEARDDYGAVVPYCAKSEKFFAVPWSYTDEETGEVYSGTTDKEEEGYYATYGLATGDGKIITDGVYVSVSWIQNDRGDGFYVASREESIDGYAQPDLIALDGSWCLHFDTYVNLDLMYYQCWSEPAMFMVINTDNVTLYTYQGEKVLDVTQFRSEGEYSLQLLYVDKEKLLVENDDWKNDKRTFTLFDYSGNKLGQLPSSVRWVDEVFRDGRMIVDVGDEQVQLMDLSGKALSGFYYDLRYSEENHCFFAKPDYDGTLIEILDEAGNLQKTLDLFYTYVQGDDGYIWLFDEGAHTFYDLNGNPKEMDTDGQEIVEVYENLGFWPDETASYYYAETANGDLYLFDTDGNRIMTLQDVSYTTYDYGDGEEKSYQICLENNILSYKKKATLELKELSSGKTQSFRLKNSERYSWTSVLNSRIIAVNYDADDGSYRNCYDVFDIETGKQLFTDAVLAESYGKYVLVATKTESILLDDTATPLIRLQNDDLI